jgi:type II secretory pathway pseudopilin PulG
MVHSRTSQEAGVTLIELVVAMAIFLTVLVVVASTLITNFGTIDMEHQRVIAAQHCRNIFSAMRVVRAANPNDISNPTKFQNAIVAQWPNESQFTIPLAWTPLNGEVLRVVYPSAPPDINPQGVSSNPLTVTVTVGWLDMRGREMTYQMSSCLTDR